MSVEGCEMALVCQGVVSQLRNHLRNGGSAGKMGIFRHGGFRKHFAVAKWEGEGGLRNGTHVPKGCFAATKIFAEGGRRLRNHFAADGRFRSSYLGTVKLFRSQGPFSQRPFLGCEISQTMDFPCFGAPLDSQISSFNFFAIPPDFDHSKRLSYI